MDGTKDLSSDPGSGLRRGLRISDRSNRILVKKIRTGIMNVLVIYDSSVNVKRLSWPMLHPGDDVFLFPLTTAGSFVDHFRGLARDQGVTVNILETARLVNDSAENLRKPYLDF